MNTSLSSGIAFNQDLDLEARIFSACFLRTIDQRRNQVFSSREVQNVAQCTFDSLENSFKKTSPKKD